MNELNKEFHDLAKPLIEWLNKNFHPHVTVVITPTTAEVLEGAVGFTTDEFIRD